MGRGTTQKSSRRASERERERGTGRMMRGGLDDACVVPRACLLNLAPAFCPRRSRPTDRCDWEEGAGVVWGRRAALIRPTQRPTPKAKQRPQQTGGEGRSIDSLTPAPKPTTNKHLAQALSSDTRPVCVVVVVAGLRFSLEAERASEGRPCAFWRGGRGGCFCRRLDIGEEGIGGSGSSS